MDIGPRSLGSLCSTLVACALAVLPQGATAAVDDGHATPPLEATTVRLAAASVNELLGSVGDSVRALGDGYARLAATTPTGAASSASHWEALRTIDGHTAGYRTWPDGAATPPAFQAPFASFYTYHGETLSDALVRQLNLLEQFAPMLRVAYESFPFSWVYLSTVDEAMVIYPYVPMEEAVHNDMPTATAYYNAANFDARALGWTPPYLDLVGAGMMVTASYPVYEQNTLLGVMSRDVTLDELSTTILADLAQPTGGTALLVDGDGLAIGASDPALAAEIDRVNTSAGAAVLYYRPEESLRAAEIAGAVASSSAPTNTAVEAVLAHAESSDAAIRLDVDHQHVLAARVDPTGWFVVLVLP